MRQIAFLLIFIVLVACENERVENPKPRAYPKIEFPERSVDTFSTSDCPFTFLYMDYANVEKKTSYFDQAPMHPCWFNLEMPTLSGSIHFSYYPVDSPQHFDKLVADAFRLSNKHNIKANYIDEMKFRNEHNASGMVFDLQGPVASPFQFYLTDSTDHFLRGALYLNAQVRPDSLAPIYKFLKEDITLILNTLEWKD